MFAVTTTGDGAKPPAVILEMRPVGLLVVEAKHPAAFV
jgi:hypothetical protein